MSSDISINQQKNILDNRNIIKLSPAYLATINGTKTPKYFIAVKYEDTLNCAKLTGFITEHTLENIITNYPQLIAEQPKENYMEISYPWHKVDSIRSLVFKQKQ